MTFLVRTIGTRNLAVGIEPCARQVRGHRWGAAMGRHEPGKRAAVLRDAMKRGRAARRRRERESAMSLERAADEAVPPAGPGPNAGAGAERVTLYVPRILQQHLATGSDQRWWTADGTAAFVDISGFTKLSEQLAPQGPRGRRADHRGDRQAASRRSCRSPTTTAAACSSSAATRCCSGSRATATLARACRATVDDAPRCSTTSAGSSCPAPRSRCGCRRACTRGSSTSSPSARRTSSCCRPVPAGAGWSRWSRRPSAGEILVSAETGRAAAAPAASASRRARACCCAASPGRRGDAAAACRGRTMPPATLARCLSPAVRAHVLAGGGTSEHRPVTIAFIRFEGTDALIDVAGARGRRRRAAPAGAAWSRRRPRRRTSRCSPPTSTPTAAS